jgi:hypothetical protein
LFEKNPHEKVQPCLFGQGFLEKKKNSALSSRIPCNCSELYLNRLQTFGLMSCIYDYNKNLDNFIILFSLEVPKWTKNGSQKKTYFINIKSGFKIFFTALQIICVVNNIEKIGNVFYDANYTAEFSKKFLI